MFEQMLIPRLCVGSTHRRCGLYRGMRTFWSGVAVLPTLAPLGHLGTYGSLKIPQWLQELVKASEHTRYNLQGVRQHGPSVLHRTGATP